MSHRRSAAGLALVGLAGLALGACSSDGGTASTTSAPATTSTVASAPSSSTTAAAPVDQTPPLGANGLAFDADGMLWVADLAGSEVVRVDPDTGAILQRHAFPGAGPDDVAVAGDGTVWWTGFLNGDVGRIDPATGTTEIVANVGTGANPIAFDEAGRLFVGRAVTADGLFEILDGGEVRTIADQVGDVNGFDVGPDNSIFGPARDGRIVKIHPGTGDVVEVASRVGFPTAARFGPDGLLYVSWILPSPLLTALDIETGELTEIGVPPTDRLDNFAIGDDGTFYVTGFDAPVIGLLGRDGTPGDVIRIGS